jgi:hypothetical protein
MSNVNKQWLVIAAVVATSISAVAVPVPVTVTRVSGYFSGNGGEFTILGSPWANPAHYSPKTLVTLGGVTGFQSFCIELNEFISGTRWAELSLAAKLGGKGGGSPDPLSIGAAWLYKQFAEGNLLGYDYTPGAGRAASAAALQDTLWWLEDEIGGAPPVNPFTVQLVAKFGSAAAAKANYNPATAGFRVAVVNMWGDTGGAVDYTKPKQDMLVYLPDGGMTLVLLGAGLLGVAAIRRKE